MAQIGPKQIGVIPTWALELWAMQNVNILDQRNATPSGPIGTNVTLPVELEEIPEDVYVSENLRKTKKPVTPVYRVVRDPFLTLKFFNTKNF